MRLQLSVVDAFTAVPFAGNPAAVAVLEAFPDDQRMQLIAREMNLPETAFIVPRPQNRNEYSLRWFSPTTEIDLCGHATLASAHVLGGAPKFHTRSGVLSCAPGADGAIEMDFPLDVPVALDAPSLMIASRWAGRARFGHLYALDDASAVRGFEPDLAAIAALDANAVIITAPSDQPGIDCVSRVFAPKLGIPEDPVTGSAHCVLAAYWGERLGRPALVGEQASARGGVVAMAFAGERVQLSGHAVTVARVELLV